MGLIQGHTPMPGSLLSTPELHTLFKTHFWVAAEVTMGHAPNGKVAFGLCVLEPPNQGVRVMWLVSY